MSSGSLSPAIAASLPTTKPHADRLWLALGALALTGLQLELLFAKSINWDELFHFSQVHAELRGENPLWLQVPHVYLFPWVPALPGSPIDHIQLIRLMLLPFVAITGLAIYGTAKSFVSHHAAALAALAYLGAGFVFLYATALRADMIAAALLSGALYILATRPVRVGWLAGAVLLCALAFVATIKSVLWAPALLAMFIWRLDRRPSVRVVALVAGAALALAVLALLAMPARYSDSFLTLAQSSLDRMFSAGLVPQSRVLLYQLATGILFSAMLYLGIRRWTLDRKVMPGWLLAGLLLPLASVLIYRNAYPYFYVFILPPAAIVAALGAERLVSRYGVGPIVIAIVALATFLSIMQPRDILPRQRAVMAGIDTIFGGPVRYIDDVGFRPDYPRAVTQFASGWALEGYRQKGDAIYRRQIEQQQVPFLFRDGYALASLSQDPGDAEALLPQDAATLERNYIQHWGAVFVAGRELEASEAPGKLEILTPGTYTLERGSLVIDGISYSPGDTLRLERSTHSIGPVPVGGATLRWGDHLPRPVEPWPEGPLYQRN